MWSRGVARPRRALARDRSARSGARASAPPGPRGTVQPPRRATRRPAAPRRAAPRRAAPRRVAPWSRRWSAEPVCAGGKRGRVAGRRGGEEARVLPEHRLVQLAEFGARIDPQLLREAGPQLLVRGERLALPPRPVQGPHLEGAHALAQRVPPHEVGEFAGDGRVVPHGKSRPRPLLQRGQPLLSEAPRGGACELLVGEVRVGGPPPQGERLGEPRGPRPWRASATRASNRAASTSSAAPAAPSGPSAPRSGSP